MTVSASLGSGVWEYSTIIHYFIIIFHLLFTTIQYSIINFSILFTEYMRSPHYPNAT